MHVFDYGYSGKTKLDCKALFLCALTFISTQIFETLTAYITQ